MRFAVWILLFTAFEAIAGGHERLKLVNDFKKPEDVIRYYCARDASGFVWTGLLDAERAAFTLWNDSPQHDSFYVAKRYEVLPGHTQGNTATVEVRYDLSSVSDGHGTRVPAANDEKIVRFTLRRENGVWRIAKPEPGELAPVVLEGKLPYVKE